MHKTIFTIALLLTAATTAAAQSPATGQRLGHDYVDLGLSVMWATCNIGASSPSDYGDYFAWGEVKPKSSYEESNSLTYKNNNYFFDIVCNNSLDAARAQWGEAWHMPTEIEFDELSENCNWQLKTIDGHLGYIITSKINGNSIFLPVAGYRHNTIEIKRNQNDKPDFLGWLSSTMDSTVACYISHAHSGLTCYLLNRFCGMPIRPVSDKGYKPLQTKSFIATGGVDNHGYVDLGLSVKWATCNIGANSPSDYGNYFAWGEAETKQKYTDKNSTNYNKKKYKYQDAASINWSPAWRLPTKEECDELVKYCTWQWVTVNGHNGYKVTSKINGESIFMPAAGFRNEDKLYESGKTGMLWSMTPIITFGKTFSAYYLEFSSSHGVSDWKKNCVGCPIRPVTE